MRTPLLLTLVSAAAVACTVLIPGWSDYLLIAAPCLVAAIVILVLAVLRRAPLAESRVTARRRRSAGPELILDGSNVMYWKDGTPQIEAVREVVSAVASRGFRAGVMFDANAGYLLSGRYRHDDWLAQSLGLPEEQVMVVDKGTPADPMILTAARERRARVVTDDRFRDWAEDFPEVRNKAHFVRGGYRDGELWLDLPPATRPA